MTVAPEAPARAPIAGGFDRGARLWLVVLVGAAVAAGVVLRFVSVSELWLDEALTVNIARLPWDELEPALRHDGAPPLYYAVLHLWTDVFGTGNVAVCALSGVFSVANLVLVYFAGRRIGGRRLGWIAVGVLAASPFAIRYASEARMYTLESLLVLAGYLLVVRALERPTVWRLAPVALVTTLLLYNQYWSPYLVAVVGFGLAVASVRADAPVRTSARLVLASVVVGGLAFVPWLPTLRFQLAHTGTPWGSVLLPPAGLGVTAIDFSGALFALGWAVAIFVVLLPVLGTFGRSVDERRVELDLRTVPDVRWIAATAGATLALGLAAAYVNGNTFEGRYAAVVFPLFVLVAARGFMVFGDERLQIGLVATLVVLGLAVGVQFATEERTQADDAADAILAGASPGDLVVYCPDQIAPAVDRLLGDAELTQLTFPDGDPPELVDWVAYAERHGDADPASFVDDVLARADGRTIWLVSATGYRHAEVPCRAVAQALATARPGAETLVTEDSSFFEYQSVTRLSPP